MNLLLKLLLITFMALISHILNAAEKPKPENKAPVAKIGLEESINLEGLKIRMFKDATARPLPAFGTREKDTTTFDDTLEYYKIIDLWIHDQYVGSWGCRDGNLTIYKMLYNAPPLKNELIDKDNYVLWRDQFNHKWNDSAILEWVRFLTGNKVLDVPEPPQQKDTPAKCLVRRYHMKNPLDDVNSFLYLVVPYERPANRYVLLYELPKNADSYKSEKAVFQSLQSLTFFPPKKADEKSKLKMLGTAFKKKDASSEFAANREKVIKDIQNLKNWWYLETDNFIIASNLKNKKTISELQSNLEKCHYMYGKYYPQKNPLRAVSVCKVFETREEYVSYVGEKYKWSGGIWIPDKKELAVSPSLCAKAAEGREDMMSIVYHEAFHQYLFYTADEAVSSVWFNEGSAAYFQGMRIKPGEKDRIILESAYYEPMKKLAVSGNLKVESLINMEPAAFYEGKDVNYPFAWGLLFFLHKAAPLMKDKNRYSEIPLKYYEALIELKDGAKATEKAWEGVDMSKFNKDFLDFWRNYTSIKRAEEYDPVEAREKAAVKNPSPATAPISRR